jgi:rare lipoprotein A
VTDARGRTPTPKNGKMRQKNYLIPVLVALTTGCAASSYPLNPQLAAQVGLPPDGVSITETADNGVSSIFQQGACSWYGPGFHGRRTSNGEVFDKNALTAAHRTLPFGSRVEVTEVRSGKKVRVRINDRGPFIGRRILDLSYAAAASLDIVHKGVANVQLRLVDVDDVEWPENTYAVEVARFKTEEEANRFISGLTSSQKTAGIHYVKGPDKDAKEYRVRFGPFDCERKARSAATKLQKVGFKPSVAKEALSRLETASAN